MASTVRYDQAIVGKNLRLLRTINELTIDEISSRSGLSKAFISLLERGKRQISTADLRKLLAVYSYTLGRFISDIADESDDYNFSPGNIVQTNEQQLLLDGNLNDNCYYLKLLRLVSDKEEPELLEISIPPSSQSSSDFMTLQAVINGYVVSGTLLIVFPDDEFTCQSGETFRFEGDRPFLFRNFTKQIVKAQLIINPPAY